MTLDLAYSYFTGLTKKEEFMLEILRNKNSID